VPATLAEKIIAAHAGAESVAAGQIVVALVDLAIAQDGTGPLAIQQLRDLGRLRLKVPAAVFFIDHAAPSRAPSSPPPTRSSAASATRPARRSPTSRWASVTSAWSKGTRSPVTW